MKSVTLVVSIVSVIMVVALAAHAPTASPISQAVEAIGGLSNTAYIDRAAMDNTDNQTDENQNSFFDPFALTGAYAPQGRSSTAILSGLETRFPVRKPPTRIPDRPVVRSPFQPSWR